MPPPELPDDVTLDALSGHWRIYQRRRGHRWSIDDLLTAHFAVAARPGARRHLDLGCGIGSVLMLVAWRLENAGHTGIEAQPESFELCAASVEHNRLRDRIRIRHADFREPGAIASDETFDLITGTPPYLPVGTATPPRDAQKAAARLELRGGVEDYCQIAAAHLAEGGALTICGDGRKPARTESAAQAASLHIARWVDLIPLPGKGPLFHVVVMTPEPQGSFAREQLLARTADHRRTAALQAIRRAFDMPPMPGDDEAAA